MKCDKAMRRMFLSIAWIIVGAVIFVLGIIGTLDEFWSGFGGALLAVGTLQLIRHIRYRINEEYKEKVDVQVNDERNKFLSSQAWAWTGYIFILCAAAGAITFSVMGKYELCYLCATAISLMVVIYFVAYMILKRKY
ncbi:MAG: hypothetical protein E7513_04685 [Ruminococcaceae bacterium]|nr:hypothetical protein [Oscillospiraceae bacterium]